jgi:hypothetical protein
MRSPRTDGADSHRNKVLDKAGKKRRNIMSPRHRSASLYSKYNLSMSSTLLEYGSLYLYDWAETWSAKKHTKTTFFHGCPYFYGYFL